MENELYNEYLVTKEVDDLGVTRYIYVDKVTENILHKLHPDILNKKQYFIERDNGRLIVCKEYIV